MYNLSDATVQFHRRDCSTSATGTVQRGRHIHLNFRQPIVRVFLVPNAVDIAFTRIIDGGVIVILNPLERESIRFAEF